jgi:hypothetical protein
MEYQESQEKICRLGMRTRKKFVKILRVFIAF